MPEGLMWEDHGSYLSSDPLSDTLRIGLQSMERFRQLCDLEDASGMGYHKGSTFSWNVYIDSSTAGSALNERRRIPEGDADVYQSSLSIVEYGKAYPYTGKIDDLSRHPIEKIVKKHCLNHANKTLDAAAHAQFDATLLSVAPTSGNSATAVTFDTDGTPSITNNLAMSDVHVKLILDQMKERNIPAYDGENYGCIGRPSTFRDFKDDIEAKSVYVSEGYAKILNGEIGRHWDGCRFIEQTAIASEGWTNAKSDAAYFFGNC